MIAMPKMMMASPARFGNSERDEMMLLSNPVLKNVHFPPLGDNADKVYPMNVAAERQVLGLDTLPADKVSFKRSWNRWIVTLKRALPVSEAMTAFEKAFNVGSASEHEVSPYHHGSGGSENQVSGWGISTKEAMLALVKLLKAQLGGH